MKRRVTSASALVAIGFVLVLGCSNAIACGWAIGYFHQVTDLRGTVVGSKFPILSSFRWYRQSVVRSEARLTFYDYCWPCDPRSRIRVETVLTNGDGKFDLGALMPGHYYLDIDDEKDGLFDEFQVEVMSSQRPTESETIDISPVQPDCSAGHEFMVNRIDHMARPDLSGRARRELFR